MKEKIEESSSPRGSGSRKTRRRWLWLTLAIAGVWGIARGAEHYAGDSWAAVEHRDLVIGVAVEGELQATDSAALGPPQVSRIWNFKISFMAPEGTEIQEGQPVLGFDTTELDQERQRQRTERDSAAKELEKSTTDLAIERRDLELQLAEAQASLRKAELELAVPEEVAKRQEVEQARIDHRLAELQIERAQSSLEHLKTRKRADLASLVEKRDRAAARLAEIEANVEAMMVKAPRAGTVIYKNDRRGDKKKVGDSAWRAETVLEIPDLARMAGEGEVAEAELGRLRVGQSVTLELDAYPDQTYRGEVRKIRRTVQTKSANNPQKIVRLVLELDETDTERMRPGMRFRGEVEIERVAGALVVPQQAVISGPRGGSVMVRTLLGKRQIFPRFGRRNGDFFEVVEGLKQGDRVLLQEGAGS